MKNLAIRGAAVAAVAGVALGAASTGVANADTFIPLPTETVTQKVGDGSITISLGKNSALLSPGMVALPTTRNAWVSGSVSVKLSGTKASGGSIQAGYVVGCQVQIGSAGLSLSSGATGPVLNSDTSKASIAGVSGSTGANLKLAAGTIGTQALTYDRKKWPKPGDEISPSWNTPSQSYDFDGANGSLSWADQTIGVDGCGGYAQARFYVYATGKVGNNEGTAVLWGKPFTLG